MLYHLKYLKTNDIYFLNANTCLLYLEIELFINLRVNNIYFIERFDESLY